VRDVDAGDAGEQVVDVVVAAELAVETMSSPVSSWSLSAALIATSWISSRWCALIRRW
jgi:hypothetical protein